MNIPEWFNNSPKKLAAVAAGVLVCLSAAMAVCFNLGGELVAITVNGQQVAVVSGEEMANLVIASYIKDKTRDYGSEVRYADEIGTAPAAEGSKKMSRDTAKQALASSATLLADGAAIYVDGSPVVYMANENDANAALDNLKLSYMPDDSTMTVLTTKYAEDVTVAAAEVPVNELMNLNEAKLALKGDDTEDAPVHVLVVLEKTKTEDVPFDIVYETDSSMRYGATKTKQQGANGSREVTIQMVQTNGVETARQEVSSNTLVEAVDEIIIQGAIVKTAARSTTYVTDAGMIWPTTTTRISSGYGARRGHTGIDIDGEYGDPVWAAKSGTVESAGYNGTYGLDVVIDHGDGIKTRYAHLQSICVSAGDEIEIGEQLGEEGSTGKSTGSHLHFEVIINGEQHNPMNYVK